MPGKLADKESYMRSHHREIIVRCALLILLTRLLGCTASPAPKVECDSNLRPINPTTLERQ